MEHNEYKLNESMLFHEGGTSSSSANMIVKPVPSMYSEIYHEKEFSFWLKETSVSDKTVIVNLHCNNDDFTENHRKDDDVSLWLLNTKFSLPSKPMPTLLFTARGFNFLPPIQWVQVFLYLHPLSRNLERLFRELHSR